MEVLSKKLVLGFMAISVLQTCVHEQQQGGGLEASGTSVREEELNRAEKENTNKDEALDSGVMKVESQDPKAIEIMNKDCDDGYDVVQLDSKSAAQVEAGVSMPIGKGAEQKKVSAFIYYRCKGRAHP